MLLLFLLFLLCCLFYFRLVYLSFCIYTRKHTYKHRNNRTRLGEDRNTNKETTDIHYFPAGTWEIFFRGRVLGWISWICSCALCLSRSFSVVILYVFCFRLVYLSFCLNTTHYTTLNTNNSKWVCHDLCQMLKVMFKLISNYMTFAADLKVVFYYIEVNSKRCISPRRDFFLWCFALLI